MGFVAPLGVADISGVAQMLVAQLSILHIQLVMGLYTNCAYSKSKLWDK